MLNIGNRLTLRKEERENIKRVLASSLRTKFQNYKRETKHMPFHTRLLGKDRLALYSFIHSLISTFGISIYEPVAIALAKSRFKRAEKQVKSYGFISEKAHIKIQEIIDGLITGENEPNKKEEIEQIRKVCKSGKMNKVKPTKIDIWLENDMGELYLIDMKTVKPNMGEFKGFKRTLLEWTAAELANNPKAEVNTLIAIPYNPYEPKPYARWTMKGMFDLSKEILVAEELWDFLGGAGTYNVLLDCFEEVGIELRPEIDSYFANFK